MESLLTQSIDSIMHWNIYYLYIFLFGSAVMENLFPPVPGDTITVFGAFLVGVGKLDFFIVYTVTTIGSSIGFILLFYAGAYLEMEFFLNTKIKVFSNQKILSAEKWFSKYGYYVVIMNRFLPGIRSVISIVAGISGLNGIKVFFMATVSALAWNFLWIYTGYTIGNNWEMVNQKISVIIRNYNIAAIAILLLGLAVYYAFKTLKRRQENQK